MPASIAAVSRAAGPDRPRNANETATPDRSLHALPPTPDRSPTMTTVAASNASTDRLPPTTTVADTLRRPYLQALTWAFTLFNSVRVLTYLPTIAAIIASGESNQHSLWTWLTWTGANLTMAAWLYEHNGQRVDRAVAVNIGNAAMCVATSAVILWTRL
jgi:hypothetical protein